jgi:hypothetical protein
MLTFWSSWIWIHGVHYLFIYPFHVQRRTQLARLTLSTFRTRSRRSTILPWRSVAQSITGSSHKLYTVRVILCRFWRYFRMTADWRINIHMWPHFICRLSIVCALKSRILKAYIISKKKVNNENSSTVEITNYV